MFQQILASAIDRCLYLRAVDQYGSYFQEEIALGLSLMNMTGKCIKTDFDNYIRWKQYEKYLGFITGDKTSALAIYDEIFQEITRIMQKHRMLFRSQLVETNV